MVEIARQESPMMQFVVTERLARPGGGGRERANLSCPVGAQGRATSGGLPPPSNVHNRIRTSPVGCICIQPSELEAAGAHCGSQANKRIHLPRFSWQQQTWCCAAQTGSKRPTCNSTDHVTSVGGPSQPWSTLHQAAPAIFTEALEAPGRHAVDVELTETARAG